MPRSDRGSWLKEQSFSKDATSGGKAKVRPISSSALYVRIEEDMPTSPPIISLFGEMFKRLNY